MDTPSGIIIVRAAPTRIPIPKTLIAFNVLPEEADLNIKGKLPTRKDAPNIATHCPSSKSSGIADPALALQIRLFERCDICEDACFSVDNHVVIRREVKTGDSG